MSPERALADFNSSIEGARSINVDPEVPPILFICGAPRSGTTLAYQAISHGGNMGTITNLVARFVTNPVLGVRLAQALQLPSVFSGKSKFGQTDGLNEPHEFGRGWELILGLRGLSQPEHSYVSIEAAAESVARIASAWEKPVVFKSFAYLWFIEELAAAMPTSIWLHIQRDYNAAASSLSRLYHDRGTANDPTKWQSAVCQKTIRESKGLPLLRRCYKQIRDIDSHISRSFASIPCSRRMAVKYENYSSQPRQMTQSILRHFGLGQDRNRLEEIPE